MDITVKELKEKMDRSEEFILIDVRESHEHEDFNIGGHLIPMGEFPAVIEALEDVRDEEIIVYCRSGRRSAAVQHQLLQAGFTTVRNLEGGMLEWMEVFGR